MCSFVGFVRNIRQYLKQKKPIRLDKLLIGLLINHKPYLKDSTQHFSAVWTRLELATPCVTGRYSNQLNYQTVLLF
jgi:hypothetical protein